MQNYFCAFEELVFLDLWILDSGFRIVDFRFLLPVSGSGFCIPVSVYFRVVHWKSWSVLL